MVNFYLTFLAILLTIGFLFSIYLLGIEIKKNQQLERDLMESNVLKQLLIESMTELGCYDEIKAKSRENFIKEENNEEFRGNTRVN